MGPDASAYRTLGLDPGADAAAVEAAYRKLIKLHHPDREGGDPARAAEINRAYQQIRTARQMPAGRRTSYPVVRPQPQPKPSPRTGGRLLGVALALGVAGLAFSRSGVDLSLDNWAGSWSGAESYQPAAFGGGLPDVNDDQPLDSDAIERSVLSAARLAEEGDLQRLASQSRHCHEELREDPDLSRLDQCIAFDEAVVALTQADRLENSGQFSTSAVIGRQIRAARLFPDDYLLIELRIDRVRSQVEFSLAPPDPQPIPSRDAPIG